MCTVTFLPVNNREFILTSNRDETIHRRPALPIREYQIGNKNIYYPKDPKANGTWIAHDDKGYTLCLLNGAFNAHISNNNYKKSRGLVLLDFYEYNDPEKYAHNYDFNGIEPFTLIIAYSCSDTDAIRLYDLKWNGEKATLIKHDSSIPQIWSSVTLYSTETINKRKEWFNTWLEKNSSYTNDDILFFHHFAGTGNQENDLIINRGEKRTVSICCVNKNISYTEIIYEDIINKKLYKNKIISC